MRNGAEKFSKLLTKITNKKSLSTHWPIMTVRSWKVDFMLKSYSL